jgi:RNA recognition motif-containing protein
LRVIPSFFDMAQYNAYGQQYYNATGGSGYSTNTPAATGASQTPQNITLQPFLTSSTYALAQAQQSALTQLYQSYQNPLAYQTYHTPTIQPYTVQRHIPNPRAGQAEANALWMGDLDPWMDESFVFNLFSHTGEATHAKIIRDKQTGAPSGYGFVYFTSQLAAQKVLENFNNQPIPGTTKVFKLNTAQHGMGDKIGPVGTKRDFQGVSRQVVRPPRKDEDVISLFIGDLAPDVTEQYIVQTFQYYYPSVYSAKVVTDPNTGISKGYGFVYFKDEGEKNRALNEMQGFYLSYRPIRLNLATKKGDTKQGPQHTAAAPLQGFASPPRPQQMKQDSPHLGPADPNNTTVFVGGVDASITHDVLKVFFAPYGEVVNVKIPYGKGCAFVEFKDHNTAASVLGSLGNSAVIGTAQVRLSWGRPSANSRSSIQSIMPQASEGEGASDTAGNGSTEGYDPTEHTYTNQPYDQTSSYQQEGYSEQQYENQEYQPEAYTAAQQYDTQVYTPGQEENQQNASEEVSHEQEDLGHSLKRQKLNEDTPSGTQENSVSQETETTTTTAPQETDDGTNAAQTEGSATEEPQTSSTQDQT